MASFFSFLRSKAVSVREELRFEKNTANRVGNVQVETVDALGGVDSRFPVVPSDLSEATLQLINESHDINIENFPDEEDLTVHENAIRLRDRAYDPLAASGLGRRILRKNITPDGNILTQDMISEANTVYEIRYDYDLNGETIEVPEGCTLNFAGGALNNGKIAGNKTRIIASLEHILDNCILVGNWNIREVYPQWFGAKGDGISDDTFCLQNGLIPGLELRVPKGTYNMSNYIDVPNGVSVIVEEGAEFKSPTGLPEFNGLFRLNGELIETPVNLTSDVREGDKEIFVSDVSIFSNYKYVFIRQETTDVKSRNQYTDELLLIQKIDAVNNTISFETPIGHTYTLDRNANICPVNACENVNIDIVVNGNYEGNRVHLVLAKYAANCNIHVQGRLYGGSGIKFHYSYRCRASGDFTAPVNPELGGHGYGVDLAGASYCLVSDVTGKGCRHTVELTTGSHHNLIKDCVSHHTTHSGIGSHGMNCKFNTYENCIVSYATDAYSTVNSSYNVDFDHTYINCIAENCNRGYVLSGDSENISLINPTIFNCKIGISIGGKNIRIYNPNCINSENIGLFIGNADKVLITGASIKSDNCNYLLDIRNGTNITLQGGVFEAVAAKAGIRIGTGPDDVSKGICIDGVTVGRNQPVATRDIDIECSNVKVINSIVNSIFAGSHTGNIIIENNIIDIRVDVRSVNYILRGNSGEYSISSSSTRPTFDNKVSAAGNFGENLSERPKGVNIDSDSFGDVTLVVGLSEVAYIFSSPFSGDRRVVFSKKDGYITSGSTFKVIRQPSATDYVLRIGSPSFKHLEPGQWCEVVFDGNNWILSAFGTL